MDFSVCIDSVFQGVDPLSALQKVKECGFRYYEFWGWKNKDTEAMRQKAASLSLTCAGLCTTSFVLNAPAKRDEYLKGLEESITEAKKMGCALLISQVGSDTGASRSLQHDSIVAGLKACAPMLEESGITLLIEPLNCRIDHIGTYLSSSDEGFAIVDEVGCNNVKLLFDIYHQQITEGDITRRYSAHLDSIGHFHAAGNPGRREFYSGELDYMNIFQSLRSLNYGGLVGLEHFPQGNPVDGLKEIGKYLRL